MSSSERIYALFVEANPVPDPELLSAEPDASSSLLHVVEGGEPAMATDIKVEPTRELPPQRGWKPAMVAAVVVLLVGVIGFSIYLVGSSEEGPVAAADADMSLVWDGEACTYSGPAELVVGTATIAVERTGGAGPIAFLAPEIIDDSITWTDVVAFAQEFGDQVPSFVEWPWAMTTLALDQQSGEFNVAFDAGRYILTCNQPEDTGGEAFPATMISVVAK